MLQGFEHLSFEFVSDFDIRALEFKKTEMLFLTNS